MQQKESLPYCEWAKKCPIARYCPDGQVTMGYPVLVFDDSWVEFLGPKKTITSPCGKTRVVPANLAFGEYDNYALPKTLKQETLGSKAKLKKALERIEALAEEYHKENDTIQ